MKRNSFPLAVILFMFPFILATLIIALFEKALPNAFASPLLEKATILPDLLVSNFWQSLHLILFDFHLLAIQLRQDSEVVWGVYWSLSEVILIAVTTIFLYQYFANWQRLQQRQKNVLLLAAILCWSVLIDLWFNSCCTAGPAWWFKVMLLSKAYSSNPYIDSINWQWIYQKVMIVSVPLRILLYIAGLFLMRLSARGQHYTRDLFH